FFQAEDGIRDGHVTGVQTCALPIWRRAPGKSRAVAGKLCHCAKGIGEGGIKISVKSVACMRRAGEDSRGDVGRSGDSSQRKGIEIGRASCRERVSIWVGAGSSE